MKFNKSSQLLLVSAASLVVAAFVTACGTLTVDFVFVTSSKAAGANNYGEVDVFEIDSESGHMRQIPTSPFPSGGRNPVAEAVSPDNTNLYVVNQDDNTIVQFVIGNDGKLYPQNTVNTPGIYPLAVAANGSNLFVVDTYQPLPTCSNADPCSGSIAVYPILTATQAQALTPPQPADTLGPPVANTSTGANYWPLTLPSSPNDVILPTGVNVLKSGADVFVSAYDSTANTGYVFGFMVGSGGALTALSGSPYAAGTHPSAIASDSTSSYVYVTDFANGNIMGYTVASGGLTPLPSVQYNPNPYPAGNQPSAIVADSSPYLYVTNAQDGTVTAYAISDGTLSCNQAYHWTAYASSSSPPSLPPFTVIPAGAICSIDSLSNATGPSTFATGLDPVAIGIDPSMNHFLFTANYLGSNVSGFELATGGTLINSQNSPYTSNAQPTAVAAIPHNGSQN